MKKINIPRIIWKSCIFLFLIVVLFMVMDYKINYQYASHNYLYFYECDDELCVSNVEDKKKELYSVYDCGYEICPEFKRKVGDDYIILNIDNDNLLYNYKKNKTVSQKYDDYEMIDNKYVVVVKDKLYGIIDIDDNVIVRPTYEELGIHDGNVLSGYSGNAIIAKKNNKYGLISYKNGQLLEDFKYDDNSVEQLILSIR